jgi:hypothetical protein
MRDEKVRQEGPHRLSKNTIAATSNGEERRQEAAIVKGDAHSLKVCAAAHRGLRDGTKDEPVA